MLDFEFKLLMGGKYHTYSRFDFMENNIERSIKYIPIFVTMYTVELLVEHNYTFVSAVESIEVIEYDIPSSKPLCIMLKMIKIQQLKLIAEELDVMCT